MKTILTLFFSVSIFSLVNAQTIAIKFCATTTAVSPKVDNNGNDQRHKASVKIDSIRIDEFGTFRNLFRVGNRNDKYRFTDGVWVDGCSSQARQTCSQCGSCADPKIDDWRAGSFKGTFEGNVRTRSADNNMYIEATELNEICWISPNFDVASAKGKQLLLNVGYQGFSEDGFETRNINISYILANGTEVNFEIKNSNFLTPQTSQVVTRMITSNQDLQEIESMKIGPNPAESDLLLEINSSKDLQASVIITDLLGAKQVTKNVFLRKGNNSNQFDVSGLPNGIYLMSLVIDERRMVKKFLKS